MAHSTALRVRGRRRVPHYPYRGRALWPHEKRGEDGPLLVDAVSGVFFPARFAAQTTAGLVDARNGDTYDIPGETPSVAYNNIPVPPRR